MQREDALFGWIRGEDDADAGLICGRVAMRHIVHLKNQIGAGRDEFRHAFGPIVGRTSGRVHQQNIGLGEAGVLAVLLVGHVRAGERNADGSVAQPIGIWRADVHDGVMNVRAAGRLDFGHLHPFIFGEASGDNFVGVVNIAVGGKRDGFGHAHNCVGLRNHPACGPPAQRRCSVRIAGGSLRIRPGNERVYFLLRE